MNRNWQARRGLVLPSPFSLLSSLFPLRVLPRGGRVVCGGGFGLRQPDDDVLGVNQSEILAGDFFDELRIILESLDFLLQSLITLVPRFHRLDEMLFF